MTENESKFVSVGDLRLHYLTAGEGTPVLLLHGWPTSSFLWRQVMVPLAAHNRVIALDLPGFGKSDKPLQASYSFRFYRTTIDGFLDQLGIESTGLVVHDLGGPVGLYWACQQPQRVSKLALLNTLVYPEMSWAVIAFVAACRLPVIRTLLASNWGLKKAMQVGIADLRRVTEEVISGVQAPFQGKPERLALLKAGGSLSPKGFHEIARKLPAYQGPVRIIYGTQDRILPDVAKTMQRVKTDLPQAEITALPGCGHFLQEDRPQEIGEMLAAFFNPSAPTESSARPVA